MHSLNPLNTFWGLKENWWKQIFDGQYTEFGPEVFDKGLHGKEKEPGYYSSVHEACQFAAENLGKPLTVEFYKKTHELACAHFANVDRRVVNMDPSQRGKFRTEPCGCYKSILEHFNKKEDKEDKKTIKLIKRYSMLQTTIPFFLYEKDKDTPMEIPTREYLSRLPNEVKEAIVAHFTENNFYTKRFDVKRFVEEGSPFYEAAIESLKMIKTQMEVFKNSHGLKHPFANVSMLDEAKMSISYNYSDPQEIEKIAKILFDEYKAKMSQLNSCPSDRTAEENEQALREIAALYQNLEWLHPFTDGQGRTDLVLLSKLLSENGFNPPILYNPYYSTFEPLEKWISYLKEGMIDWRKEQQKPS